VEAALAEPKYCPLQKEVAPPHPTQKPPYSNSRKNISRQRTCTSGLLKPLYVFSDHLAICLKASLLLLQYQRGRHGMLGLFWTDFPRYFAGGGREGHR
jgi:hypothetical protein